MNNFLILRIINKVINILYKRNSIKRKEVDFSEGLVLTIRYLTKDNKWQATKRYLVLQHVIN